LQAAANAFAVWRQGRASENQERMQALLAIRDFIDRHHDSRFTAVHEQSDRPVKDRAGYYRDDVGGRVFLFNVPAFAEATKGFDRANVLKVLEQHGVIPAGTTTAKQIKVGQTNARYFEISEARLGEVCHGS